MFPSLVSSGWRATRCGRRTNSAHWRYCTMSIYMIRAISYEPRTSRLIVAFVNGRIVVYEAVPPEIADDFLHAVSKDAFFAAHVHHHYRVRDVTRRAA
jgi:KTSC domain